MGLLGSIIGTVTGIIGGNSQKKAASKAADSQLKAAQLGIDEQKRQFDITQQNFAPYLGAGTSALDQINDLLGLGGSAAVAGNPGTVDWAAYVNSNPEALKQFQAQGSNFANMPSRFFGAIGRGVPDIAAFGQQFHKQNGGDLSHFTTGATARQAGVSPEQAQQLAIDGLRSGPLYQSLYRNGENAVLSNASATGGLRGGNAQGSLYNLGADTLSTVIQQHLANLGGIANMGQGSAGQLGGLGLQTSTNVSNLMGQKGAARAGEALARGGITAGQWQTAGEGLESVLGSIFGGGGIKF